ncbi:MAG: PEGA domain-containing protein [ANME-2 cluster archaeon]|nr:MAG: PEGA domain-containing protein [ANME-2 cluster archaeon]
MTITSGDAVNASFTLTPIQQFGTISINSTPSGASIYLERSYQGTTPKDISDVPIGSHIVKLSKQDYDD